MVNRLKSLRARRRGPQEGPRIVACAIVGLPVFLPRIAENALAVFFLRRTVSESELT
jgi:hypothetical protein